tara:strand:- start:11388 stop:12488 length:1101 start_codon:yes stop_codon:yes gene_type:complete
LEKKSIIDLDTGCDYPDGIYSHEALADHDYHALPRASATLFKFAINDPMEAWSKSWLNPRYKDEKTDAMKTGSAYHKRFLEGSEAFAATYKTALKKEDYQNLLVTIKDMKEWLSAYNIPIVSKATKSDLIALIQEQEHAPPLWDVLVENHKTKHAGMDIIKQDTVNEIEFAHSLIEQDPIASAAITGGQPEVSLLYTLHLNEDGPGGEVYKIKCKARIDYLKYKSLIDLKTFSNYMSAPLMRVINKNIVDRKYNVQAVSYLQAWHYSIQNIKDNKMHGSSGFKSYLIDSSKHAKEFWFLFQQTKVPNAKLVKFPDITDWYRWGEDQLRMGQLNFCRKFHQNKNLPWTAKPELETWDDEVPNWAYSA